MALKDKAFATAACLLLLATLTLVATLFRYDLHFREGTVVKLDRWTGSVTACDGQGCIDLPDRSDLKPANRTPRDLLDEIERSPTPPTSWREKVEPVEPNSEPKPWEKFQQ